MHAHTIIPQYTKYVQKPRLFCLQSIFYPLPYKLHPKHIKHAQNENKQAFQTPYTTNVKVMLKWGKYLHISKIIRTFAARNQRIVLRYENKQ